MPKAADAPPSRHAARAPAAPVVVVLLLAYNLSPRHQRPPTGRWALASTLKTPADFLPDNPYAAGADAPSARLWEAFRAGEAAALACLFELHYDGLFRYGCKLTGDEELVKDCIQNLFQKLWRRREGLRAVQVVRAYLFKALRRHLGDETKLLRQHRHLLPAYTDSFEVTYSPEEFMIAEQHDAEQRERLLRAINQLSKRQREALYLKFFDGFSYERIAEVMSLRQQSVRNLVFNALQVLRKVLATSWTLVLLLLKS